MPLRPYLPEGEPAFDADYITDQPERFMVGELVREKILRATHQEVPHSVAVLIDKWEQPSDKLTRITATIYVERTGQKGRVVRRCREVLGERATSMDVGAADGNVGADLVTSSVDFDVDNVPGFEDSAAKAV